VRCFAWSPDASVIMARHYLENFFAILRGQGLKVASELEDHRPLHAMDAAVQAFKPDLIVISTHPEERSQWLRQDIVERARSKYGLPIRHIVPRVPVEIFGT
jgi:GABA permease